MSNSKGMVSCAIGCWLVAALAGLLAAVLLMLLGSWTFVQAVFAAGVVFVIAGLLLNWILCRALPAPGEVQPGQPDEAARQAQENRAAAEAKSAAAAQNAAAKAEAVATADSGAAASSTAKAAAAPSTAQAAAPAPTAVKASTSLAGQDELSARKGEWKYENEAAAKAPAKKAPAKKAAPKSEPKPAAEKAAEPKQAPVAADGKPETLSAARAGGPDDLKMIKGVGPKLEALLHSMGFYHFDQVAGWRKKEVEWVDENLEGFKGRVTRDEWVKQAKILAKGGTTEFSKKVDKGGVY